MSTIIHISQIIHDGAITGRHSGRIIREAVAAAMQHCGTVAIDFSHIEMITQSAADEFIGRIMRENPDWIGRIQFENCDAPVREMIQWSADHADAVYRTHQTVHA